MNLEGASLIPHNRKVFGYKSRHEVRLQRVMLVESSKNFTSKGGHPNIKSHEAMDIFRSSVSPPPSTDTKGGALSLNWLF